MGNTSPMNLTGILEQESNNSGPRSVKDEASKGLRDQSPLQLGVEMQRNGGTHIRIAKPFNFVR